MQILNDVFNFFIPNAHAADAAAAPQGGGMSFFVLIGIMILFMYFAMWRPQSKRAKEHRNLINSLAKGDEVMTAGGILGRIAKVNDNYVTVALNDTNEMIVQKNSIVNVLPKGTLKTLA
jgi:preprotein translocase subunit YajC